MKKLMYKDKIIKRNYDYLLEDNRYLLAIMNYLLQSYSNITLMDIQKEDKGFAITLDANGENLTLRSNSLKYESYLLSPNWDYIIVFSNLIKKNYVPKGKLYYLGDRRLLHDFPNDINPHHYLLDIYEEDKDSVSYDVRLRQIDDDIDDEKIIHALLVTKDINRLKDLLDLILLLVDAKTNEIVLKKQKDLGSHESELILYKGRLTKYNEFMEEDNKVVIKYLNNGHFYQKTIMTEEIDDEITPLVKKKERIYGKKES